MDTELLCNNLLVVYVMCFIRMFLVQVYWLTICKKNEQEERKGVRYYITC